MPPRGQAGFMHRAGALAPFILLVLALLCILAPEGAFLHERPLKHGSMLDVGYDARPREPGLAAITVSEEASSADVADVSLRFRMKAYETGNYGNVFQTAPGNGGLRLELSAPASVGLVVGALGESSGFKGYPLLANLEFGRWYEVAITLSKGGRLHVLVDGAPVVDVEDGRLRPAITQIAVGAGFSLTRPFIGAVEGFRLEYDLYSSVISPNFISLLGWAGLAAALSILAARRLRDPSGRWTREPAFRSRTIFALLALAPVVFHVLNVILPSMDFATGTWVFPRWIATFNPPLGRDFLCNYEAGQRMLRIGDPYVREYAYPPLVPLLFTPFALLSYDAAYKVMACLLAFANGASILLGLRLGSGDRGEESGTREAPDWLLFWMLAGFSLLADFSGYGFMFSLERANYDILAMLFSVWFLAALVRRPRAVWLQAALLAVAVNLKVYPAILAPLMLWRSGARAVAPLAVCNLVLLGLLGYGGAHRFYTEISQYFVTPFLWLGNHSAASFARHVVAPLWTDTPWVLRSLTYLPLCLWLLGSAGILLGARRRDRSDRDAMLYFILCVPVMNVLPSTSHDYKLVILFAPAAMYAALLCRNILSRAAAWDALRLVCLLALVGWLCRSPEAGGPLWVRNKFVPIMLFQALALTSALFPPVRQASPLPEPDARAEERGA